MAEAVTDDELCKRLDELLAKATPGPWHHCQPYMTVPAQLTVHGPIPAERVDYVSTWPGKGTPSGHRVVIDMPGREGRVRSEDMALIAAMRNALPDLLARIRSLASENAGLREERDAYKGGWDSAQEEWQAARMVYFDLLDVCGCKDGGELQDKAQRAEAAEASLSSARAEGWKAARDAAAKVEAALDSLSYPDGHLYGPLMDGPELRALDEAYQALRNGA